VSSFIDLTPRKYSRPKVAFERTRRVLLSIRAWILPNVCSALH